MADHAIPPQPVENWWRIDAKATEGEKTKASIHIYDAIGGWWGIRVSELVKELANLDVDEIDLYINSPGGDAFGGLAIMNALRRHSATVTVHVDGLAASAASVIALGGDIVEMGRGAQLMIHDASTIAWGPAATMTKKAEVLNKLSDSYAAVYAAKAGDGDVKRWRKAMLAESWYTAQEAVDAGLADRVIDQPDDADEADVEAAWQPALALYRYAGRSHAPAPTSEADGPSIAIGSVSAGTVSLSNHYPLISIAPVAVAASPAPGDENPRKEPSMAFMDDLRQRLGADADADEAGLLTALDERLAAPNVPEGATVVENALLGQLQADAKAGRDARDAQLKAEREAKIDKAIDQGRIHEDSRADWIVKAEKDPDMADFALSMPVLINMTERGYTTGVEKPATPEAAAENDLWGKANQTKEADRG